MLTTTILLVGAFVAASISGFAGFGGALLLLPLLTRTVGVEQAVPMLTVAQLVGNLSRIGLGWRRVEWKAAGLFLVAAMPAAGMGAVTFSELPPHLVARLVGVAILVFTGLRFSGLLVLKRSAGLLLIGGASVGFLSGLVGSAGPMGAAIFLSLGLSPVAYIATEAVTAVGIHLTKLAVYQQKLSMGLTFWPLALAMGAAMFAGTWTANRFVERVPRAAFERVVGSLLVAMAIQMILWP